MLPANLVSAIGLRGTTYLTPPLSKSFTQAPANGQELSMFSTLATFGTALDITLAELSIESFFPADPATEAFLRA